MTLKITRFLTDAMNKQAKISHWGSTIKVGTPDKLKSEVKQKILDQFGELFLNDANYVIMSTLSGEGDPAKETKRFADLIQTVLDTEVNKTEIKEIKLSEPSQDEEGSSTPEASALLMKLTTK